MGTLVICGLTQTGRSRFVSFAMQSDLFCALTMGQSDLEQLLIALIAQGGPTNYTGLCYA